MPETNERRLSEYARRVWIAVGIVTLVAGLLTLLWFSLGILLMVFAGLLLTLLFSLPANWLHRHSFLSRRMSLVAVLLAFIAAVIVFGMNFATNLGLEFERLANLLPGSLEAFKEWVRRFPFGSMMVERVEQLPEPDTALGSWSSRLSAVFSTTLDVFLNTVAVVLVGLFVAFEPDFYRNGVLALMPPVKREGARSFLVVVERKMAWWLFGRLISMTIIGTLFGGGLWSLGVPMALSLGILAGLLSFIPYLGPVLALIPALLVAFTVSPQTMLYVGLLYVGIQLLESNLITPLVQRQAVSIPPALLLMVQLGLGFYAGLLGLLISEPLIVLTMLGVQRFYIRGWLEGGEPATGGDAGERREERS